MTYKVDDRIFETSVTTGTGTYALDGPVTGYQAFSEMTANNYCPYFVTMDNSASWEAGIGQVLGSPARLARAHVLASSNSDAAVDWGAGTKNIRCGQIAALAVPRRTAKSVAGSSNVTLTQNEMRCDVLEFTGVLTGNIDVIVDDTVWDWSSIYNNTSGAFTLTFKVAGQPGILIPTGSKTPAHCNGTDVLNSTTGGALVNYGSSAALAAGSTRYLGPATDFGTDVLARVIAPFPCVVRNLFVDLSAAPVGAATVVVTLMKNGSATTLAATLTGANTNGSNTTNLISFAANDNWSVRVVTSAGCAATQVKVSFQAA